MPSGAMCTRNIEDNRRIHAARRQVQFNTRWSAILLAQTQTCLIRTSVASEVYFNQHVENTNYVSNSALEYSHTGNATILFSKRCFRQPVSKQLYPTDLRAVTTVIEAVPIYAFEACAKCSGGRPPHRLIQRARLTSKRGQQTARSRRG